jgi:hypothetical protein
LKHLFREVLLDLVIAFASLLLRRRLQQSIRRLDL